MDRIILIIGVLFVSLSISGCSDVQNSKKHKAWVKPINGETCAQQNLKMLSDEYGKEIADSFGSACFLRTSTNSYAFYSPEKSTLERISIDNLHCSKEMLKVIDGADGAELVVSACAVAGPIEGKKSSGKQW